MRITKFDRATCRAVQDAVNQALLTVAEQFGLTVQAGRGKFSDATFTISATFAASGADGAARTAWEIEFKQYAVLFGLEPEWFGREIMVNGQRVRIVGLRTKASKRPVVIQDTDGRQMVTTVEAVINAVKK